MELSRVPASDDFADVYAEHVWVVYAYVGYRVARQEDAEDLTQQTFEQALKAWGRFDPDRASAKTWLLTIAHNLVIDSYRRKRGDHEELDETKHDALGGSAAAAEHYARLGPDPALLEALAALSDRDREVIALRFCGDMTGPEIATITGLTLANVQQILSRSLRRLRSELAVEVEQPSAD